MLAKKIGLVAIGAVLAIFAIGQVAASTAWAQSWDDPADEAVDSASPAPDATGTYSGNIDDHRHGSGTISATITQTGKVLSGTWSSDVGGVGGKLSGKINASNDVTMTMKVHGQPGCVLDAVGTFENGDQISAAYHTIGCRHSDHGHFDMTD